MPILGEKLITKGKIEDKIETKEFTK